jgi:sulfide:quinone oxidoreductase
MRNIPARSAERSRISILGAGFAALTSARLLRKRLPAAEITLVAPKAEFSYLPSLIWVPTGLRARKDILHPLDGFLTRNRIAFKTAAVTGIADGGRYVETSAGPITNDALVIATGGRFVKKLPGIEHALTLCEGIDAAEAIRTRIAGMNGGRIAMGFGGNPQEPSAMRGGPMFELLFGIDTFLRKQKRRDSIQITFFNAAAEPGRRLGERAVRGLLAEMARRGIETHLGHKVLGFSPAGVDTEGGHIEADLILFMPGLTGPAWAEGSDLPKSPGGFIQADEFCRVPGFEHTYVAGDAGSFPGPDWLPKQAHMADLQATAASLNLVAGLFGKAPTKKPRTEIICLVDTLNSGILVYRDMRRSIVSPSSRLLHWSKRAFETQYLRNIR